MDPPKPPRPLTWPRIAQGDGRKVKLDPKQTAFGRHETFPLRYAWLTKGFQAAQAQPDLFSQPDQAMVRLGVGRNMVNAIQYWLQAAQLMTIGDGGAQPTRLGQILLGPQGDCFLEDEATLWILHWLIASNTTLATGFFWFFNRFAMPRFQEADVRAGLTDFVERELGISRARSTLKSDTSTLLRMYAPSTDPGQAHHEEDHLDTPMGQLRLLEQTGKGREYRSLRTTRPFLPPLALHFALAQRFRQTDAQQPALPVRELVYGDGEQAAPGAVFRLTEEGFMTSLTQVLQRWPGHYELRDTAGIHQLYRLGAGSDPASLLASHYREAAA
jgi:hypothetical protein